MDFFVVWIIAVIVMTIASIRSAQKKTAGNRPRRTVSSDGHVVPPSEDLTVDTGTSHYSRHKEHAEEEFGRRYIVHNEPVQGYVILNGVMRSLEECKDL